jgi:hypothetical protein
MKPIKLQRHESARAIFDAHDRSLIQAICAAEGADFIEDGEVEWEGELSKDQIIAHVEREGFWAWCDQQTRTIHYWFADFVKEEQRLRVIAHEVAHLSGKPAKDEAKEEQRADAFAEQVVQVMMLMKQAQ